MQIFVRALFDYDPSTDDLMSCREAALAFSTGDILHILAKDDHHWWQARHWTPDNMTQSLLLAGLIPSSELLEWKTSCSTIERAKRKHSAKIGGIRYVTWKQPNCEELVTAVTFTIFCVHLTGL